MPVSSSLHVTCLQAVSDILEHRLQALTEGGCQHAEVQGGSLA